MDLASGRLDGDEAAELERHIEGCDESRRSLSLYRAMVNSRDNEPPLFTGHPSADELVQYATDDESLDDINRAAIEAHLADCQACQDEVQFARDVEAEALADVVSIPATHSTQRRRFPDWVAYAAAAVVLLMIYPTYRGVRVEGRGTQTQATLVSPALIQLYEPIATRSRGDEVPTHQIAPDRQFVQFAFGSDSLTTSTSPDDLLALSLVSVANDRVIWDAVVTRGRIYEPQYELYTVVLPSQLMDAGLFRLVIGIDGQSEALVSFEFAIDR